MKNLSFLILLSVLLSCSNYQKLLKSTDYDNKYESAISYFNNNDYSRSLPLLEDLLGAFKGSSKSEDVYYYYIYCTFHLGDYYNASYHFKNFSKTFFSSTKAEEMSYMAAYCLYLDSPEFNFDQTNTYDAINELELFISEYPNSDKIIEAEQLISDLNIKLEEKEFEIAKLYYETEKYKSSLYAFNTFIEKYPNSNNLEDVLYIQTKAYYELAKNSIEEKKKFRIKEFIFAYQNFILTYPDSKYLKEIKSLKDEL